MSGPRLRASPRFNTSRFDDIPAGVLLIAPDGLVVYANRAAARLFSMAPAEFTGCHLEALAPLAWPGVQAVFRDGAPLLGSRFSIPDGEIIAHHFPLLTDGKVPLVISYLLEVYLADPQTLFPTPYKEVVAQLEAIMESSFDGLWICDHRGIVVKVNQAALKLIGLPREEVEKRHVLDLLKEGNFEESVTLEVLQRQTTVTMLQHLKTGKVLLVTGVPIFNSANEVAFVVINDRDITLLDRLRREIEKSQARLEHFRSQLSLKQIKELEGEQFICQSRPMKEVYEQALRVAPTNSTVLITGETGVGKGFLAKLIHKESARASGAFIRVDCAAIPGSLFESEMFGYARGAFTGADLKGKPGLVELAKGGTLFLDEISEINPEAQVKLLRFLDERRFIPVGGSSEKELDTRVLAATNKDLPAEVGAKRFRHDLFYRFNVVPIHIPPLRERPLDIMHLTRHFLQRIGDENRIYKEISPQAMARLLKYPFPGNIRELENIVERMLIMSTGQEIEVEDLPFELRSGRTGTLEVDLVQGLDLRRRLRSLEIEIIQEALQRYGSQRRAASHLGLSQSSLARKLQKAGH
ncbi:MAG: sigma 54-interacting transcriptional regulator [Thermodesulfobacteriota bacterium]